MAKQLSMEELIKKFQYLQSNRQASLTVGMNQNSKTNNKTVDDDSKLSSMTYNANGATGSLMASNETSADLNTEEACKVCLDAVANCAFIECGHIVCCLNCAKLLTRCPVCRETIKRTLRVYKS
ncbi:unnamed protein product [Adineta ricciae]|uniref:RING-type domain-containing protein n=1 Tax=Adineta ricciae TaxID=249248 RepID=A0A813T0I9_ADIRI|nr:unnamed protein product [Adineta ricciae]CAF0988733.1 unnamed protein product [Adineta ricciae]